MKMKFVSFLCLSMLAAANAKSSYMDDQKENPLNYINDIVGYFFSQHQEGVIDEPKQQPINKFKGAMNAFQNFASLGDKATLIFNAMKDHQEKLQYAYSEPNPINEVFANIKDKIKQCYEKDDAEENDDNDMYYNLRNDNADPIHKEFMIIQKGMMQLHELIVRDEGYMNMNIAGYEQMSSQEMDKEFWILKLLESKAFLKILCGMMNVEWDLLVKAVVDKLQ